jgi:hypothetical protein
MADSGETLGIARNFESGTMNKLKAPAADCSRSLASTGIERNSAAVQYYNKLIEERLSNFEFQILESSYTNTVNGISGYLYSAEKTAILITKK